MYDAGGANDETLDFSRTAARLKMVVVTFNYRLGIFGFLGGQELGRYCKDGSTGNAGFLDQRLALRWVQSNIEAFHGDPNRVLVLGENSGAAHVSAHMVSEGSKGLFQRAMMLSGAFRNAGQQTRDVAQANFNFVASKTGCVVARDHVVECLQALPSNVLTEFLQVGQADKGYMGQALPFPNGWINSSWTATIDGVTLTAPADLLARQGKAMEIPVILGSAHDAGTSIATQCRTCRHYIPMTMGEKQYGRWLRNNFPEPWSAKVLEAYSLDERKPFWSVAHALTDYGFKCPTYRASNFLAQRSKAEIFVYNFHVDPVGPKVRPEVMEMPSSPCTEGSQGVSLGSDVLFFMDVRNRMATTNERLLASALSQYLRNFAWSGQPNTFPPHVKTTPLIRWPAYDDSTRLKLWIGSAWEGNITVKNISEGMSCDLWDAYWKSGEPSQESDVALDASPENLFI
jgi:carboxylesterase type B